MVFKAYMEKNIINIFPKKNHHGSTLKGTSRRGECGHSRGVSVGTQEGWVWAHDARAPQECDYTRKGVTAILWEVSKTSIFDSSGDIKDYIS
jgi:hypothetical protein